MFNGGNIELLPAVKFRGFQNVMIFCQKTLQRFFSSFGVFGLKSKKAKVTLNYLCLFAAAFCLRSTFS
jgi:hypothetical protein